MSKKKGKRGQHPGDASSQRRPSPVPESANHFERESDVSPSARAPAGVGSPSDSPAPAYNAGAAALGAKWLSWLLLAVLLGGLGVATHLTRTHLELLYGDGSFDARCDFGEGFNCSDVIASSYASLFGVLPWSIVGIAGYAAMIMLVLRHLSQRDRESMGLVILLGLVSCGFSAYLFFVSKFLIGSYCPFCMVMYGVNLAAVVLPVLALKMRLGYAIRWGLRAALQPRLAGLATANFILVAALAFGGYASARAGLLERSKERALSSLAAPSAPSGAVMPTAGAPGRRTPGARHEVPLDDTIPWLGSRDAPVTIVAYEDFECGFCKRLAGNLEALVERYPADVRVGFRHFPMHLDCNEAGIKKSMHPNACRAAIASECARQQDHFWEYHDLLFKNPRNLSPGELQGYARDLGLDLERFQECQSRRESLEKVRNDSRTGGGLGVTGTPTFFVNGRSFSGAQSEEVLAALVEAEKAGKELTVADLRALPLEPDITGPVTAPGGVRLTGPHGDFEIDAFEASIVGGKAVARAGSAATTGVTWFEADAACRAVGKRLCTEGEWLAACSGALPVDENGNGDYVDDRLTGTAYPYGDFYKARLCHDRYQPPPGTPKDAEPPPPPLITGNHPECRSAAGIYDLTGNAREWIGTVAADAAFIGGAFYSGDAAMCQSRNESVGPFYRHEATGFRCCQGGHPPTTVRFPGRQVGERLLPFRGQLLDGQRFDSSSLEGHVTLLTFWASWCGPCRQELPAYASVYPELEKKGFRILSVNVDEDPAKARAFLEKHTINFPVLLDTDNTLLQSFDSRAMPTSFLLDGKGNILLRRTGFEKGDEKRLVSSVEKLLAEP